MMRLIVKRDRRIVMLIKVTVVLIENVIDGNS